MTNRSTLEEITKTYRKNLPAVLVMEGPVRGENLELYTISLENPEQTALEIESILRQAMETSSVHVSTANRVYLPNDQVLMNVHDELDCEGQGCSIHHPSEHHMKSWRQFYLYDRKYMTRICPTHNLSHPDPDDKAFWKDKKNSPDFEHKCCGCCTSRPSRKKALVVDKVSTV